MDNQIRTLFCQLQRDRPSNASRCTRYDTNLIGQLPFHRSIFSPVFLPAGLGCGARFPGWRMTAWRSRFRFQVV